MVFFASPSEISIFTIRVPLAATVQVVTRGEGALNRFGRSIDNELLGVGTNSSHAFNGKAIVSSSPPILAVVRH